jgi:hypothetical protein
MKFKLFLTIFIVLLFINAKDCQAPNSEFGKMLEIIYKNFDKYGINNKDRNFLLALAKDEGNFKNLKTLEKRYNDYSYGTFQVLYYTARDEFGIKNRIWLENAENNIDVAIRFFKILKKQYKNNYYEICSHWKTGKKYNKKYYVKVLKLKNMLEKENKYD